MVCQELYTYYFHLFQQHRTVGDSICILQMGYEEVNQPARSCIAGHAELGFEQIPDSKLRFFPYATLPPSTQGIQENRNGIL